MMPDATDRSRARFDHILRSTRTERDLLGEADDLYRVLAVRASRGDAKAEALVDAAIARSERRQSALTLAEREAAIAFDTRTED